MVGSLVQELQNEEKPKGTNSISRCDIGPLILLTEPLDFPIAVRTHHGSKEGSSGCQEQKLFKLVQIPQCVNCKDGGIIWNSVTGHKGYSGIPGT